MGLVFLQTLQSEIVANHDTNEGGFYLSPGIQFGWTNAKSTFLSFQCTIGYTSNMFLSGRITVGKRYYYSKIVKEKLEITYFDLQGATWLGGSGIGLAYKNKEKKPLFRSKSWGGFFLNFSKDNFYLEEYKISHYGAIIVLPIPLFEVPCVGYCG